MNKAFPAHLQGVGIGLAAGTGAVHGPNFYLAVAATSIVCITVGYILEKRVRGES